MSIKDDELARDYLYRIMNNVGQQRSYGEEFTDQKVAHKVLGSLSPKINYVIPLIEVVFDLCDVSSMKLCGDSSYSRRKNEQHSFTW